MSTTTDTRPLAGKTALVTGGARRIGAATALALGKAGANVIVHYMTSARDAAAVADSILAGGSRSWVLDADLCKPEQAERLIDRAIGLAGAIDILVNNASIFPADLLTDVTIDAITRSVNLHAIAPLLVGRRFYEQGRPGAIVNFLDTRIVDYDREHASYHLGKRMLFTLTRMMAIEFAPAVRVNAVAPGLILPPPGRDMQYLEELAATNPLNKYGSVDEVANAVLFLSASDFITGQVIFVDGGRHLRGSMYGV
jgi:NAD(P)-dependent dehydrogenase (short-subunit alcohol dehydrogenase family)